MKKIPFLILAAGLVLAGWPARGQAQQTPQCRVEYTVQAGDWLSKIAEKYLGDPLTYPRLVAAANASHDDRYTNIENPDVIEPGWVLCIPPAEGEPMMTPTPVPTGLTGSSWILTALNGQPSLSEAPITADFSPDGRLSGTSGCNSYSTTYEIDGSVIAPGLTAGTMMACANPIMQQEIAYLTALNTVDTFEIQGDRLLLKDSGGETVLEFVRQHPVELTGTLWRLTGYNNGKQAEVGVIAGTELTADFSIGGRVSGSSGCNTYSAAVQVDGQTIRIGPAVATRMFCANPEGIMAQEQQYLTALQSAAVYLIELNRLELRTASGELAATFERIPSANN